MTCPKEDNRNRRLDHPSRIEYDLSFRNHVEPGTFNTLQGGASSGNKMNTTANPGGLPSRFHWKQRGREEALGAGQGSS